jgi:hypothetical protein
MLVQTDSKSTDSIPHEKRFAGQGITLDGRCAWGVNCIVDQENDFLSSFKLDYQRKLPIVRKRKRFLADGIHRGL